MAIPDHVKQQAMDAVSGKTTTAQIRLYCSNDQIAPETKEPPARGVITDDIRRQAMDAVGNSEVLKQVKLVVDNGSVFPMGTPARGKGQLAAEIGRMHEAGRNVDSIQSDITKDGFGREYA